MASASSSLASGYFLFALVKIHLHDRHVVYERIVSECFKIGYLQQQQIQKI